MCPAARAAPSRTFTTTVIKDDGSEACGIEIPFNPKETFGKVRAPITVTIRKHTYRTTIFRMGGKDWFPLAKVHRDAAGVSAGDRIRVTVALDESPRTITPPPDLKAALAKDKSARAAWDALSYTHKREHTQAITEAKKPETRARRLEKCLAMLRASIAK